MFALEQTVFDWGHTDRVNLILNLILAPDLWPWPSILWVIRRQFKVSGQSVQTIQWKQTDGADRQADRANCITFLANAVGNNTTVQASNFLYATFTVTTADENVIRYGGCIYQWRSAPCNSPCAASLAGDPPGGIGLSGLVHEEAHPDIFKSIQFTFKCVDAGCIDRPLVQLVPPCYDSIREKISPTVPRAPSLN